MKPVLFLLVLCVVSMPVFAGEVSPFKECGTLRNMAGQEVLGVIRTGMFQYKGHITRHEKNFDLKDGEFVEVCSTGPFYEGYRVELTIRTLLPLFTCKTRLSGDIIIRSRTIGDVVDLYAECK